MICAAFVYLAWFAVKSGGGPPHSRTLARSLAAPELREASWSAPVLWRFERAGDGKKDRTKFNANQLVALQM